MSKEKKFLLFSVIFFIIAIPFELLTSNMFDDSLGDLININGYNQNYLLVSTIISYIIYGIGAIYLLVLALNKKIDLSYHYKGILGWSLMFFLGFYIVSGILAILAYSGIEKKAYEKRELPVIEDKEFTNKWICLIAFIICMFLMFFVSDYIKEFWQMILLYIIMLSIMVGVFFKQLVHDFKYFKAYFKEYVSLSAKTWLKSLLIMMILSLALQIFTTLKSSNNQQTLQSMFNNYPIFVGLLAVVYAPIAEELMFRGVFKKFIKSKYLFILISGITFGLLHVIDDSKTLAEFAYVIVYATLGVYLASLYYKTNNLFSNILFHFFQNALGVIGMILLYFMK